MGLEKDLYLLCEKCTEPVKAKEILDKLERNVLTKNFYNSLSDALTEIDSINLSNFETIIRNILSGEEEQDLYLQIPKQDTPPTVLKNYEWRYSKTKHPE